MLPDWKMTLNFDSPLAAFEAADGIINTRDLQTIEIRPKNYMKSTSTGSGINMLAKFRKGQQARLNAVNLNGYTYSCDSTVQENGQNSVAKFVPTNIQSFPDVDAETYVFPLHKKELADATCDEEEKKNGCDNKKEGRIVKIYCKKNSDDDMKCSRISISTTSQDSPCPKDIHKKAFCQSLIDKCEAENLVAMECFSTCFCEPKDP